MCSTSPSVKVVNCTCTSHCALNMFLDVDENYIFSVSFQGDVGTIGETGIEGEEGAKGPKGDIGAPGLRGAPGIPVSNMCTVSSCPAIHKKAKLK